MAAVPATARYFEPLFEAHADISPKPVRYYPHRVICCWIVDRSSGRPACVWVADDPRHDAVVSINPARD